MNMKALALVCALACAASCAKKAVQPVRDAHAGKTYALSFALGQCGLSLKENFAYEAACGSEGPYWYNEGKYRPAETGIVLEPALCAEHKGGATVDCAQTLGRAECGYRDDNASLYHTRFFVCRTADNRKVPGIEGDEPDSVRFPVEEFRVKPGSERVHDGVPIVTMGLAEAFTTDNVKIREKPSVDAKALQYFTRVFPEPEEKALDYVPKGVQVKVIARTRDSAQVGAWNNYWYLLTVGMSAEVWMFGEFVKLR